MRTNATVYLMPTDHSQDDIPRKVPESTSHYLADLSRDIFGPIIDDLGVDGRLLLRIAKCAADLTVAAYLRGREDQQDGVTE